MFGEKNTFIIFNSLLLIHRNLFCFPENTSSKHNLNFSPICIDGIFDYTMNNLQKQKIYTNDHKNGKPGYK